MFKMLGLTSILILATSAGATCPGLTSQLTSKLESSDPSVTLCKSGYEIAYNTTHKIPHFVVEPRVSVCTIVRTKQFGAGSAIQSTKQANKSAYRQSDYDIGHLAAASNHSCDKVAYNDTFLYTNAAPQVPNFNRGQWRSLEKYVQVTHPTAVVYTGVVFPKSGDAKLGVRGVAVPTHFWKIIVPESGSPEGYMMENREYQPGDKFTNYRTAIPLIEFAAGVKFTQK